MAETISPKTLIKGLSLIFILLVVFTGTFYLIRRITGGDLSNNETIIPPKAPLSSKFQSSTYKSNENSENILEKAPSKIIKIEASPNGETMIVLTEDGDGSTLYLTKNISPNDGNLAYLTSNTGEIIEVIRSKVVTQARYLDKGHILYHVMGDKAAIYKYDLQTKKSTLVISTTDPQNFKNVDFMNDTIYFYANAITGEFGVGKLGLTDKQVIAKKTYKPDNYTQRGSLSTVSISPDKKYVAYLDFDSKQKFTAILNILTTTDLKQVYSGKIYFKPQADSVNNKILDWSFDSKYLIAGSAGKIINLTDMTEAFDPHTKDERTVLLATTNTEYFVFNKDQNSGEIRSLADHTTLTKLPKDILNAGWIDGQNLLLQIGDQLYVFDYAAESNKLHKIKNAGALAVTISDLNHTNIIHGFFKTKDNKILQITGVEETPDSTSLKYIISSLL